MSFHISQKSHFLEPQSTVLCYYSISRRLESQEQFADEQRMIDMNETEKTLLMYEHLIPNILTAKTEIHADFCCKRIKERFVFHCHCHTSRYRNIFFISPTKIDYRWLGFKFFKILPELNSMFKLFARAISFFVFIRNNCSSRETFKIVAHFQIIFVLTC